MDPDAALAAIRAAVAAYGAAYRETTNEENMAADEIVESFEALDEWLSKGGFLPAAWAAGR